MPSATDALRPHVAVVGLALAGLTAVPAPRQIANPPLGYTGGFDEPTCQQCHIGGELNAFGGSVRIVGLPEAYAPGESYLLTVRLSAEETEVAGFQMTARFVNGSSAGKDAGMLRPADERTTVRDTLGVTYAHHSERGTDTPERAGSSWTLEWVAPTSGVDVRLDVAGNSGNGDQSPLGDLVFTHAVELGAQR